MAESADIIARDAQNAARLSPDVGQEKVGEIYARALLGAAEKAGQTVAVLEELDAIVSEVFAQFPKLETVFGSLLVSHVEKTALLDNVFASQISRLLLNFLKVVSRHGRLDCLRAIRREARKLHEEMQGNVRVRVTTATAVDQQQIEQITATLGESLGQRLILETVVDPALIGGIVLRIGDTVYDGSVANQLQSIRQQMIDRSVHEIQSRRDRFRYPAGS
ncbi:MAG: ATP synthase F1 subunit delta [Planctomycetota bacterium]